ncbi:MAG: hypothetical protein QM627_10170 [Luteolibacter sp.]
MNDEKIRLLANGIVSISDAVDEPFWDVLDALIEADVLDEGHRTEIEDYMETL